jgi:hypothetical protein
MGCDLQEFLKPAREVLKPYTKEFINDGKVLSININNEEFSKAGSCKGRLVSALCFVLSPLNLIREVAKAVANIVATIFMMIAMAFGTIGNLLGFKKPDNALEIFRDGALKFSAEALAVLATPVGWAATTARCFAGIFHPGAVFTNYEEPPINA